MLLAGTDVPIPDGRYDLTVGTPDVNGAATKLVGSVTWKAYYGAPGPPHDTQSFILIRLNDVRCTAAATTCGSANVAGGADYTGELEGVFAMRITDHHNGFDPTFGGNEPGTMTDYTLRFPFSCNATADDTVGSTCSANHNPNSFVPAFTPEGKRTVWELGQARFYDGGADGVGSSAGDNTLFLVQGLFVP